MQKNRINAIFKFLVDDDRKSLLNIYKDLKKLKKKNNYTWKNLLFYYFMNIMYKKNAGDIFDYINQADLGKISSFQTDNKKHPILANKLRFSEFMFEKNIPTAKYIGKIESGILITCFSAEDQNKEKNKKLKKAFIDIIEKHKILFVK